MTPSELRKTRELRERAAALIETRGWYQGDYVEPGTTGQGRVCAIGAIYLAAGYRPTSIHAPSHVGRTIEELEKKLGRALSVWNDTSGRTKAEVLALLRDA